jgi:hypothetical protein
METEDEVSLSADELWAEYKSTGSRELRDKLIVRRRPRVRRPPEHDRAM